MDPRSPHADELDAVAAAANQAAKYPYRLEGDAASGYTIISNDTNQPVKGPVDHATAAAECKRLNYEQVDGEDVKCGCGKTYYYPLDGDPSRKCPHCGAPAHPNPFPAGTDPYKRTGADLLDGIGAALETMTAPNLGAFIAPIARRELRELPEGADVAGFWQLLDAYAQVRGDAEKAEAGAMSTSDGLRA